MPVLPDPVLRAAVRWLDRLPVSSVARCRTLFVTNSRFSDITPTQYEAAYTWLHASGLVSDLHSSVSAQHRVFDSAVVHGGMAWFPDFDALVRGPEELPEDALRAANVLGIDEASAYAHIVAAWGKVNTAERERIGAAGELALVDLLTRFTEARVDHVAAVSDGHGYDIAFSAGSLAAHIEVKTTVRRGRLTIYLSRNEYETSRRDPSWLLVVVRLTQDLHADLIATVPGAWFAEEVPLDRGPSGRWESCRFEVPIGILELGIPPIRPLLSSDAPAILGSPVAW